MSIDFSPERWERVKENSRLWWEGKLDRPLVQFTVPNGKPDNPQPKLPLYHFTAFYDLSIPAEDIIEAFDAAYSGLTYLGDAFPNFHPNFGPGVVAAFLGCELGASIEAGTCWFHPLEIKENSELKFEFTTDNIWVQRIADIYKAGLEKWKGNVLLSMTDLGGNLDILSSFRPAEKLMYDIYDYPEEVKRLTWEAHEAWWKYYDYFTSLLQPTNPGYSAWASIYSDVPYYMLQCDFCYMIGPDMFDEFVRPELDACCRRMPHGFYHLDGVGELPHLDSLLSIEGLKGIQWVPGSNAPSWKHWPDLYKKILDAGKLLQIYGDVDTLDTVVEQVGTGKGIVFIGYSDDAEKIRDCVKRYGAE
jgi:hypothetical protein